MTNYWTARCLPKSFTATIALYTNQFSISPPVKRKGGTKRENFTKQEAAHSLAASLVLASETCRHPLDVRSRKIWPRSMPFGVQLLAGRLYLGSWANWTLRL